jgi:betaine lipid synthase
MLGLVAAQLKYKVENKELRKGKAIWVDVRFSCSSWPRKN